MIEYSVQPHLLVAVNCVIFGFDGEHFKLLLIQRGKQPELEKWSLMGGFIQPDECTNIAASRILNDLTGLQDVYMEQLHVFSDPKRNPFERTICVAYFALIDINKFDTQLSDDYRAEWFLLKDMPNLIFDHNEMVMEAQKRLRYKAALHPILFELLPGKFTIPQLQSLYERIYDINIDKRNFSKKVLSTNLLIKQNEKDKLNSKKGAYYYILDKEKYAANFQTLLNVIPIPNHIDLKY